MKEPSADSKREAESSNIVGGARVSAPSCVEMVASRAVSFDSAGVLAHFTVWPAFIGPMSSQK